MNKDEKMIEEMLEEMAIIISGSTELDTMNYYRARYKAKDLYNANYRKITADEVVIKKDEYETLKAQNDSLELSVKDLSYRNAQVAEANKLFAKRNDELLDELQGAIRIKEKTTREILQKLKACIENSVGGYLLIDRKGIRELATELGIELGWDYE